MAQGHPGECTGMDTLEAEAQAVDHTVTFTVTNNRGSALTNTEVMIDSVENGVYTTVAYVYTNNRGIATAALPAGTYYAYASYGSNNSAYEGEANFVVEDSDVQVTLNVNQSYSVSSHEKTYNRTTYFNHIDIRVAGTFTNISLDGTTSTMSGTISDVYVTAIDGNNVLLNNQKMTGTTNYEWRNMVSVSKAVVVTVKFDLTLSNGTKYEDLEITFQGRNDLIQAIADCDIYQGLDFEMSVTKLEEAIRKDYKVAYEWEFYDELGNLIQQPEGINVTVPTDSKTYDTGEDHTVDATFTSNTYVTKEVGEQMYVWQFSGWTDYKNETTATNWTDITDADSSVAGTQVDVVSDTDIYGKWTLLILDKADSHLTLTKTFSGITKEQIPSDFEITITGPAGGEEKITLADMTSGADGLSYTYSVSINKDGKYKFTESGDALAGYAVTTAAAAEDFKAEHDHITDIAISNDKHTVEIELDRDFDGGQDCDNLGSVNFTNTYEKQKQEEPVHNYPAMTIIKEDVQNQKVLAGAVFALYKDDGTVVQDNIVTNEYGIATIDFEGLAEGTYVVKEITAPAGYALSEVTHTFTLTKSGPVEQLIDGVYVDVYTYTLTGEHLTNGRLHVNNTMITAELTVTKAFAGDLTEDAFPNGVTVTVSGPNGYTSGDITLNAHNNWTHTLTGLEPGEYTVSETAEDVAGYAHTVSYAAKIGGVDAKSGSIVDLSAAANQSAEVNSGSVTVTNTYTKKTGAPVPSNPDLTVYKVRRVPLKAMANVQFSLVGKNEGIVVYNQTGTTTGSGTYTFTNLPEGTYTLTETAINGQTPEEAGYAGEIITFEVIWTHDSAEMVNSNDEWYVIKYYDINGTSVKIGDVDASMTNFDGDTNLMTVHNDKITNDLQIVKRFTPGTPVDIVNGVQEIGFRISGPNNYSQMITMNKEQGSETTITENGYVWTYTLEDLAVSADAYTVEELSITIGETTYNATEAEITVSGKNYVWHKNYDPALGQVHITADKDLFYVDAFNTLTEVEPIDVNILKYELDDKKQVGLAGATFSIYRAKNEITAGSTVTTDGLTATVVDTTREGGVLSFPGFVTEATWILEETAAPENFETPAANKWVIKVTRNDATVSMQIAAVDAQGKVGTFDHVTGNSKTIYVQNNRETSALTITKKVIGEDRIKGDYELPSEYEVLVQWFAPTGGAAKGERTVTLSKSNNWTATVTVIPHGYYYFVRETTTGAFESDISIKGETDTTIDYALMDGVNEEVTVTNTYNIETVTPGLDLLKHDVETKEVLDGAEFTLYKGSVADENIINAQNKITANGGKLHLEITEAGTYYLVETKAPGEYHENSNIYKFDAKWVYDDTTDKENIVQTLQVTYDKTNSVTSDEDGQLNATESGVYHVTNTKIKNVPVSVIKQWNDDNNVNRPKSIEAGLYKVHKDSPNETPALYETVTLSESNGWTYAWEGLTDEWVWSVNEVTEIAGYNVPTVTQSGDTWAIVNTRDAKPIQITVNKAWDDNYKYNKENIEYPEITVTLFKDGNEYDNVTLNAENSWTYTWSGEGINDAHNWTVDEIEVPFGYTKTEVNGETVLVSETTGEIKGYAFNITNTRVIQNIEVKANKIWVHGENPEAAQPTEVKVNLYRMEDQKQPDDTYKRVEEVVDTQTLNKDNNWSYAWRTYGDNAITLTDEYLWRVEEVAVSDYVSETVQNGNDWTITNTFNKAKVTVTKTVEMEYIDENGDRKPLTDCPDYGTYCPEHSDCVKEENGREYAFVLSYELNGKTETEEFTLKKDESKDLYVPVGAEYTVTEVTNDDTFWNPEYSTNSSGEIKSYDQETKVVVNNLYIFHDTSLTNAYEDLEDGIFTGIKVDSKTNETLTGAKFGVYSDKDCKNLLAEAEAGADGKFAFHFKAEGTYYLKELTAPENYKLSDKVYEIKVTAEYGVYEQDGEKIVLKVLRATSDDLDGIGKERDEAYLVPNVEYGKINVSVSKVWLNPKDYDKQPTSVVVALYCDGELYETVTLSESGKWSHKWTDLYENHEWTVDELEVPKDYSKKITHVGNAWVITNAHKDIPLTGDDSNVLLWAGATGVAVVGLGASLFLLLKKRKKDEDEQA